MTDNASNDRDRPRYASHLTRTRFLHAEDAFEIGKLRFYGGAYKAGQGTSAYAVHYLDIDDARVWLHLLSAGRVSEPLVSYKGSTERETAQVRSRVLKLKTNPDGKTWVELAEGPGQQTATGAIKPSGQPDTCISIAFSPYEAARFALAALAAIHAHDVVSMLNG